MLLEVQCEVPQSVMIWAAMSSAGVGPLCFLKSTVNTAIYQEILEHFMLPSAQLSGHSTETALLSVTEALRLARAASKSSVLILLDLSAAFDTVNHQILMSILRKMGISGTALLWFESYLSDRSFRVSWRGEVSKSQLLATGVPQGSVLGPLLFSIYMSSLGSVIQSMAFLTTAMLMTLNSTSHSNQMIRR